MIYLSDHLDWLSQVLFAFDILQQAFVALDKIRVTEALLVLDVARFVEVIHVELADEATEVVVFEVLW